MGWPPFVGGERALSMVSHSLPFPRRVSARLRRAGLPTPTPSAHQQHTQGFHPVEQTHEALCSHSKSPTLTLTVGGLSALRGAEGVWEWQPESAARFQRASDVLDVPAFL